jgi:uncharacterized protein Usg
MSNQFSLKIPQVSDRTVVAHFVKIGHLQNSQFAAQLPGQTSLAGAPVDSYGQPAPEWAKLLELDSALLISLTVQIGSIGFTYRRGGENNNSPVFDDIYVSINPNVTLPAAQTRLELIALTKKLFKAFDPNRALQTAAGELGVQAAALHESTLTKLEEVATGLVKEIAQQQIRLADEYRAKGDSLEEHLQKLKARLQHEHDEKLSELRKQEESLAARQSSIDDRDNTHARRETRNKLLEDVEKRIENFGVTAATERKRVPVLGAFLVIFVTLFYFGAGTWLEMQDYHKYLSEIMSDSKVAAATNTRTVVNPREWHSLALTKTDLYILWGRLSLIAISLVGLGLYFIRWQNRWAEQHSVAEFQLQQFYLDVNRANWVVESGLEWNKETGNPIPSELLGQLTHNLFKAAAEPAAAIHPADELASALLGSASKLKLKAGNSELEFNKPGKIPEKT